MIQYNSFEVKTSELHSVFDLLYKQYTAERFAYEATHSAVSEHLSENLVYGLLLKAITKLGLSNTDVLCHRLYIIIYCSNSLFHQILITGSGIITCCFSVSISSFLISARFTVLTLAEEPS